MQDWNPDLYRRYEEERTRPAVELLARVPLQRASLALDLGCGPGNSTELLVRRFPMAQVLGIDNSPAMVRTAVERVPQARFVLADLAHWESVVPQLPRPDLIYANAALQWVPDHDRLIPRLFSQLAPSGVLAIQIPDNLDEPTNRLMRQLAARAPWDALLRDAGQVRTPLLGVAGYYDLLARQAATVDVWHTIYQHRMASPAAIIEWLRATALRPFLEPLPAELQEAFIAEYQRMLDGAYPARADGGRLLAFPRLFILAQRRAAP